MRSLLLLLVPACFSPSPPTGVPCATDQDCPSPQRCDPASQTCQLEISTTDAGTDGASDSPVDGPAANCWAAWKSGTPQLTTPISAGSINTAMREQDAVFTDDALGLYFVRSDVLMFATRQSRTALFSDATGVDELKSSGGETRLSEALGGKLAVFESRRMGGEGGPDFWVTARMSPNDDWGPASQTGLATINDAAEQFDPELTADGLHVYLSNDSGITGQQRIQVASRGSTGQAFADPVDVPIDITGDAADPAVSPDELVMMFSKPSGQGPNDIHFATRASKSDPFTTHGILTALDSIESNGDADFSTDGCTVILGSDRIGGAGNRDLYLSEVETD